LALQSETRGRDAQSRTSTRSNQQFRETAKALAPSKRGSDRRSEGEAVFQTTGCALCHIPVLTTGANHQSLIRPEARHARFCCATWHRRSAVRRASEIRTTALWGLRFRRPLLHDGSAATAEDAILRHAQEAAGVTDKYRELPAGLQRQLLAFLNSL
jgi:CxxC motif-containing protein (DUF1111 family)